VKLLLATDSINPVSKDTYGQTLLSCAAGNGHHAVVKMLLATDGINPDPKDTDGQTPLWWAAENGHEAVQVAKKLPIFWCIRLQKIGNFFATRRGHQPRP
jgi:ankyrin repeat protein